MKQTQKFIFPVFISKYPRKTSTAYHKYCEYLSNCFQFIINLFWSSASLRYGLMFQGNGDMTSTKLTTTPTYCDCALDCAMLGTCQSWNFRITDSRCVLFYQSFGDPVPDLANVTICGRYYDYGFTDCYN